VLVLAIIAALSLDPVPAAAQAINNRVSPDVEAPPGCPFAVSVGGRFVKGPAVPKVYEAGNVLGHTPQEIHQRFAAVQEMNFARGNPKLIISRLSSKELRDIASLYDKSAPRTNDNLLRILAARLDGKSLMRVADAFGTARVDAAVKTYASTSVQREFTQEIETQPMMLPPPGGGGGTGGDTGGTPPSTSETLQEVYLDYRTAPVGNTSPAASITEAGVFSAVKDLTWVWTSAYTVGEGINWLIDTCDPSLSDAIGGTEYTMLDDIDLAATEFDQGNYEAGLDDLFGNPIGTLGDEIDGDWETMESFGYWYESGGRSLVIEKR